MDELTEVPLKLDLRHRIYAIGRRMFAAPYLPNSLIFFTLLLILTEFTVILLRQPASYWADYSYANVSIEALEYLLTISPWLFVAANLIYQLLIGLVLYLLTRSLALAVWMVVCFFHLRSLVSWARCGLSGIYRFSDPAACETFELILLLVFAGLLGLVFARTLLVSDETAAKTPSRRRLLSLSGGLTIAWLLFLAFAVVRTVIPPDTGWIQIEAENLPPGRVHGAMAYDTVREKAVLFGGASAWLGNDWQYLNDTWSWDGAEWQQYQTQTAPLGRVEHAVAFDENRGVLVLFGGKSQSGLLQDTWEWDGQQWQIRFPANSPSPRCCHKLFYDSQRGKVVLYGGYDERTFFNDGWEWDGENWQPITFETPGPSISGFPITYDRDLDRVVAMQTEGTWTWQGQSWSQLDLDLEPPIRSTTYFAYDPIEHHTVLFGGAKGNEAFYNDTWFLDEEGWQEFESPRVPGARWGHAIYFDAGRQRIVLFGGFDGANYANDMWELVIPE